MRRRSAGLGSVLTGGALSVALTGCLTYQAHVMSGDSGQVVIQYSGDVRLTLPLARQFCAQYERLPELRDSDPDSVTYACVAPQQTRPTINGGLNPKLTLITDLLPAMSL